MLRSLFFRLAGSGLLSVADKEFRFIASSFVFLNIFGITHVCHFLAIPRVISTLDINGERLVATMDLLIVLQSRVI
jgi:hypothetical protein